MQAYACPRCGNVVQGDPASLRCPRCGYPEASPAPVASASASAPSLSPVAWSEVAPQRPSSNLATALAILVLASAGLGLLLVALGWGHAGSPTPIEQGLSTLGSLASLGTVLTFCFWLHRVAANARSAAPAAGVRPGLAVGSFFIPFAHLVWPYFLVRKAWRAHGPRDGEVLLTAWFVAFAAGLALAYLMGGYISGQALHLALRAGPGGQVDPGALQASLDTFTYSMLRLADALLEAVAAVLLALLAPRWSRWQDRGATAP